MKSRPWMLLVFLFTISISAFAARPMTVEDMWAMKRIGDVQLSPDGEWIAYTQTKYDMEANKGNTQIWLVSANGGTPRQLTTIGDDNASPRWKPDGSAIAFLSSRDGSNQVYLLSLAGGEAKKVTDFPVDVDDFIWSPDGSHFAFTARVYADAENLAASGARDKNRRKSKVEARIIDHLLFRSWNRWTEGKRTHVFVCTSDGENVVDVTPGEYDAPPLDLGGNQDYRFSPDGTELAFVSNHDPLVAASTNNDIFIVSASGGKARCITTDNKAVDNQPLYSPDGKYILYRAMKRPGFEADQYELILYERKSGARTSLTEFFDLDPDEVVWSPDSKRLFFNAKNRGRKSLFVIDLKTKKIKELLHDHYNTHLQISPNGERLFFKQQSVAMPDEIFCLNIKTLKLEQLTFVNRELLSQLELRPVEDFQFRSFDGQQVHGFILKPPFFDASEKYPMIYLIHGGPQGMWSDDYHYRWNASMFAVPGYVVAMVNFRGSKGYGQAFCDAVSRNWGGGPYRDLMAGLDYLYRTFDFIDTSRVVAAGASFGGFMINWIATHTDRFKALVCHAGVYDQRSMYGATEELWFPEWEFAGTPYEHPELYEKWSPSTYAKNLAKFKTPTLVIHGQHDYRVPVTQGFQMFTALQRMGVPSKLIYFPDETHFVTKPQNARLWWSEIFAWFDKWLE